MRRRARGGWIALALLCASCGAEAPDSAWPPGLLLSASRPALANLLASLEELEGTPLARAAQSWRSALPACTELEALAPDGDPHALLASLRCADSQGPLAAFHRERGERDLLLALPGEPGARATAHARLDGAAARIELRWPALDGRLADVLPGDEPAGPDRLAVASRVAHGRARAAGPLDLAAWVPRESQGDRLFHLRDRMLSAALLDGTLEVALYQPLPGAAMPRSAAALGVRQPDAARVAAERFVGEIAATWRMRQAPFTSDVGDGACLPDLHIMPELAPCYALARDALIIGWNEASLRHALASVDGTIAEGAHGAPSDGAHGAQSEAALPARFDVDLASLRAADQALAARLGREAAPLRWPWRRLRASAERREGALEVQLLLEPERAS